MKKVLILSVMLLVLSLPTFAAYQMNWTENFDWCTAGALAGQHGWTTVVPTGTTARVSGNVVLPDDGIVPQPLSESKYYKQQPDGTTKFAANAKNMMVSGLAIKRGRMEAWLYDFKNGSTNQTDTRIGVHSTVGDNNIGYIASVNVTDVGAGNTNFWRAQWSYTALNLDGTTANSSGAGWSFSNPVAVPRVEGWNKVIIEFGYNYPAGGSAPTDLWVKWFINHEPTGLGMTNYDLSLVVTSGAGSRWTNMGTGIAGMFLGSTMGSGVKSAPIDNVVFKGNVVPEPTSFLALGTGLVGLMGLIRRKR